MASPLYCELSVAKTQATEFLFHASESAFALKQEIWCWSRIGRSKRGTGDSRREWHVRFGSKADICSAKSACPLYPRKRISTKPKAMSFREAGFSQCFNILRKIFRLPKRKIMPHLGNMHVGLYLPQSHKRRRRLVHPPQCSAAGC